MCDDLVQCGILGWIFIYLFILKKVYTQWAGTHDQEIKSRRPGALGWILRKEKRILVGTLLKSEWFYKTNITTLEQRMQVICLEGDSCFTGNRVPISVVDSDQG